MVGDRGYEFRIATAAEVEAQIDNVRCGFMIGVLQPNIDDLARDSVDVTIVT